MNEELYVNIVNIKRFAVHDGEGIRTTAFFKGCPMRCRWCHNPETLSSRAQTGYYEKNCRLCGACVKACPQGCHTLRLEKNERGENEIRHEFRREKCTACGALLRDRAFYAPGGVTLSGGECLLQSEACAEVLCEMKKSGVNTAVDTCGNVPREAIEKVLPYTDAFLYDLKHIDGEKHRAGTGCGNKTILDNLLFLNEKGARTEIRYPLIPGFNAKEEEIKAAAQFLKPLKNIIAVRVLPYHNLAGSKYAALGLENTLPPVLPSAAETEKAREIFRKICNVEVK